MGEKNLLDLKRTYKNKENSTKTGGDGTTTKTTTYAKKKNLCKSLAKKKRTVFSILPFAKIVSTIKKHHPPSYQKAAYTFQNDIQSSKNCTKAFMKKEKCMRKSTKKNIDEIPPIHINIYLKFSSLICQSYISISL